MTTNQPRLSQIDVYRFQGEDLLQAVVNAIEETLGEGNQRVARWKKLNNYQQGLFAWSTFYGEVLNGGLAQFFYNRADAFIPAILRLPKVSENARLKQALKQATEIYRKRRKEFDVEQPFGENGLFARMTELAKLDEVVVPQAERATKALAQWLRTNLRRVVDIDGDTDLKPSFTGTIETRHPNGKPFEQASVQKGRLHGPYKRFHPNGTLDEALFYERGEISADYWPTGQPKHKTMKRGKMKVHEWYYASGTIQKRFVADNSGDAAEPVRLWHENGQLAEEIHLKRGKKFGPWSKFFPDGSPRLQAECQKGETLIVKNAWDDSGKQTVKNGAGIYFDDGLNIDVSYRLFFKSDWTTSRELRNGIPHGLSTTWFHGVLWSKDNYANGKLHGSATSFYDNGRVRSQSTFRYGKEVSKKELPKFDHPQPAVLLKVRADDELYTAWRHRLLDRYPIPTNLKKIQAKLPVPQFLLDVFARNQAGKLENDYEDWNDFEDGVTYMVIVNERGTVDSVQCSGASAYSGGSMAIYPPYLRQLKFKPGRVGNKNVRCQIAISVEHTFVEGRSG